jgi:hypothetical protein
MAWFRTIALGATLAAGAAACGYPTFKYGSSTGTSSSGDVGGTGGQGTTASTGGASSTSSSSSSTSSGTGGDPGCNLLGSDCSGTQKCAVTDEETGHTGCIELAATLRAKYATCTMDTECGAGQWCEHRTHVCKPICHSSADCSGAKCTPALTTDGFKIAGLNVCVVDCDPIAVTPCSSGATCDWDNATPIKSFDCFSTGNKGHLEACMEQPECAPSLTCSLGACSNWCTNDFDCPGVESCYAFDSFTPVHGGTNYGWCG